ncbi:MAG: TROVE domain-containing protein [Saprospiraceae bacterium]|nr:TROVE domain-containing protein [Saprospiraceae bacterium]
MALFNFKKTAVEKTVNLAGGEAFVMTPELELASLVLTSFAQEQFYRDQKASFDDLAKAMSKCAPEFVAKTGVYARREFGMRSITHALAAELASGASGQAWAKSFYDKIINRPDDMLEIAAYYKAKGGKNLPNAMKKGFASAFDRFDAYQLAKYRGENKALKLVDLVNLVRPVPTAKNADGLKALVEGTLRNTETWEAKLTQAGQKAESDEEKMDLKAAAWTELVKGNRLGYFALVRNLRNILEQAPELTPSVCAQLVNKDRIRQSLVLPFRLVVAYKQLDSNNSQARQVREYLSKAIDIACQNIPALENTLVVVDNSGSMGMRMAKSEMTYAEMGALFGMALAKRSNADLMEFGDTARYIKFNLSDSAIEFSANFQGLNKVGHGTNFHSIFEKAQKRYDRIVIFSDMQGWVHYTNPTTALATYKRRTGANPYIYSFDLAGYGSLQFPERNVFALAGFSEKVFDLMRVLETDRHALVNKIKSVAL